MTDRFIHEEDIEAAYDAAELVLEGFIDKYILLIDDRARRQIIGKVSRAIADAVIRSDSAIVNEDITEIPGVDVEYAKTGMEGYLRMTSKPTLSGSGD